VDQYTNMQTTAGTGAYGTQSGTTTNPDRTVIQALAPANGSAGNVKESLFVSDA